MGSKRVPVEVVMEYSDAVVQYGPDSAEARQVYAKHVAVEGFVQFAKALGDVARSVGSLKKTDDSIKYK